MRRTTDEYVSLITQFHIHRERFTAVVEALTSAYVAINDAAASLPVAFDLDSAVGVQLDVDGQWIGRDRFVPYPLETFYFSWDDPLRGWDMAVWAAPYEAEWGEYRLGDEDYRRLLYAKIGVNYWDGTFESAERTLLSFYEDSGLSPGSLFFLDDRGDTSAIFGVAGKIPPPLIIAMLAWEAVKFDVSGGRLYTLVTSVDSTPLFGFDVSNSRVAGWDVGSWGVEPQTLL